MTNFNGIRTSGIITETEAYAGVADKASHAHGGKRTARNAPMYEAGGIAYVYLCYGIHHLFNVVTNAPGVPHAILVRAIHPMEGLPTMMKRRGSDILKTTGPGTLTQALDIRTNIPEWIFQRSHSIGIMALRWNVTRDSWSTNSTTMPG